MSSQGSVNNDDIVNNNGDNGDYDDYLNPQTHTYFRNLNLRYFACCPIEMIDQNRKLMELCLEHGNPEAHYIEGIIKYFVDKDKRKGVYHLRQSSIGNNDNGTFLFGLIMLSLGYYPRGKKYLDKLNWREDPIMSDQCWERIKNSLLFIPIEYETRYYTNMVNLRPRRSCHPEDNMALVCTKCYYYKRCKLFYQFAGNAV